jgi:hypothetical protein
MFKFATQCESRSALGYAVQLLRDDFPAIQRKELKINSQHLILVRNFIGAETIKSAGKISVI